MNHTNLSHSFITPIYLANLPLSSTGLIYCTHLTNLPQTTTTTTTISYNTVKWQTITGFRSKSEGPLTPLFPCPSLAAPPHYRKPLVGSLMEK